MDPDRGYSMVTVIGEGGFGYVSECLKGNAVVAIKHVKINIQQLKKPAYEAKCLKVLGCHENILLMVDQFKQNPTKYCLVTELCLCTVRELQNCGVCVDLPDIKAMFHQMLEGLDYIHSKGMMHRDIKPENVLVSARGLLKISDFGAAVLLDEKYEPPPVTHRIVGTRWYMSPEMLLYKGHDTKTDIWSLACTFAEMFIRLPLFPGSDEVNQLEIILHSCTRRRLFCSFHRRSSLLKRYRNHYPIQLENKFYNHLKKVGISDTTVAILIRDMLIMDPQKRPDTTTLLQNPLFEGPAPDIKIAAYDYLVNVRKHKYGPINRSPDC